MDLIGLCGYAKVGKDMAAKNMPGWKRMAFADALKADLQPLFDLVAVDLENPEDKEIARPLMVEWGKTARRKNALFWISRLFESSDFSSGKVVITDVRYPNEVRAIEEQGGKVIYISRPGFFAANPEEQSSILDVKLIWKDMPVVVNDSTPKELGRKVMEMIGE